MRLQRRFLGWDRPLLPAAVDTLVAHYTGPAGIDLSQVIVVTPTSAAGPRLLELLVERSERQHLALTPPQLVTPRHLPELLYDNQKPWAGELQQELAWVKALRELDSERLKALLPHPPKDEDLHGWRVVARMLADLHRKLAADRLDFQDVTTRASELPAFDEADRWQTLEALRAQYLAKLDALELWDQQTARLVAIDRKECRTDNDIVLVGAADMNRALRAMLDQVAHKVTAYIFAPERQAARFDEHGCLVAEAWVNVGIPLDDSQIEVVDSTGDQADAAMRWLASLDGKYSADEITIAAADDSLVPYIQQRLAECGLRGRFGGGTPMARSGPFQLLRIVGEYVDQRRSTTLAELVRHPAVEEWLQGQEFGAVAVSQIDDLLCERLPAVIDAKLLKSLDADSPQLPLLEAIHQWLKPLQGPARAPAEWAEPIVKVLLTIYGNKPWNRNDDADRQVVEACEAVVDAIHSLRELRVELAPQIRGGEALEWLEESLAGKRIPSRSDPGAIEISGWLDLLLDDAPAAVVLGFNDGIVPGSLNGDLFLPDGLRRQLGIEDNDRRYARDAYALQVLTQSRAKLHVIAGRRAADGNPLLPSRLLFATSDDRLSARTLACFKPRRNPRRVVYPATVRDGGVARFEPPQPSPLSEPVTRMRVTEFRDYLACPYRYYLKHRLRLEACEDGGREMDEMQFGNLIHEVLKEFGESKARESQDATAIEDFLTGTLEEVAWRELAATPWPAVRVQVELARQRLRGFARWQAEWRAKGNQIFHVEADGPADESFLLVDDEKMYLKGRIDRIDYNANTRQWTLFDYKTGAKGAKPGEQHVRQGNWVDLQLPLYRHLARGLGVSGVVSLGYIALPAGISDTGDLLAPWSDEELATADEVAADVVRKVRKEEFWPPNEDGGGDPTFARIVGEDRYATARNSDAEDEAS